MITVIGYAVQDMDLATDILDLANLIFLKNSFYLRGIDICLIQGKHCYLTLLQTLNVPNYFSYLKF